MNYSKSLSELLFEETNNKEQPKKQAKKKKEKIVARITKLEEASFLLIPKDEINDFTSYLVQGALGKLKTYFSKEVKAKSQNADTLDDLKKDNSAENVPGLERGSKTLDISYNYVSNKLDAAIGDALKTAIGKGLEKNMQPLAILKQIQKPRITLAGKKYRFNFVNRGKKDTETISGPDIALFNKLGHAFFTLVIDDPTDSKQDVYYSNNDHILVFAYPIVEEMTATQFKVHNALYNVDVKKKDMKENFIHYNSLSSLLFENTSKSEVEVEALEGELGLDADQDVPFSDPLDVDPQVEKTQRTEETGSGTEAEDTKVSSSEDQGEEADEQISPQEEEINLRKAFHDKMTELKPEGSVKNVTALESPEKIKDVLRIKDLPRQDNNFSIDNIVKNLSTISFNVHDFYLVEYANGSFYVEFFPKIRTSMQTPSIITKKFRRDGNKSKFNISKIIETAKVNIIYLLESLLTEDRIKIGTVYHAKDGETIPENEQYPEYLTNLEQYEKDSSEEQEMPQKPDEDETSVLLDNPDPFPLAQGPQSFSQEASEQIEPDPEEDEIADIEIKNSGIFPDDVDIQTFKRQFYAVWDEWLDKRDLCLYFFNNSDKFIVFEHATNNMLIHTDDETMSFIKNQPGKMQADSLLWYYIFQNKIFTYEFAKLEDIFDARDLEQLQKRPEADKVEDESKTSAADKSKPEEMTQQAQKTDLSDTFNKPNVTGDLRSKVKIQLSADNKSGKKKEIKGRLGKRGSDQETTIKFNQDYKIKGKEDVGEGFIHSQGLNLLIEEESADEDTITLQKDRPYKQSELEDLITKSDYSVENSEVEEPRDKLAPLPEPSTSSEEAPKKEEKPNKKIETVEQFKAKTAEIAAKLKIEPPKYSSDDKCTSFRRINKATFEDKIKNLPKENRKATVEYLYRSNKDSKKINADSFTIELRYVSKEQKFFAVSREEKSLLPETLVHKRGLDQLLKENSISKKTYDLETLYTEFGDILITNITINKTEKQMEGAIKEANAFKKDIEIILKAFSVKPGLKDIKFENIKVLDKIYNLIKEGKKEELSKYKPPVDNIKSDINVQLSHAEKLEFFKAAIKFIHDEVYKKNTKDFLDGVQNDRITDKDYAEFLNIYFKLDKIQLGESDLKDSNVLNEDVAATLGQGLGAVTGFFGKATFVAIYETLLALPFGLGYVVLFASGLFGLNFILKQIDKIAKTSLGSYFKDIAKNKEASKRALSGLVNNQTFTSYLEELMKSLVAFTVLTKIRNKYGIDFSMGQGLSISSDIDISGDFAEDFTRSITKEVQSGLFTKEFRKFEESKAKRDLKDDDLIAAYELKLDNLVMSYMKKVNSDALEAAQIEKENLAYRNRMDVMDSKVLSGLAIGAGALAATVGTAGVGALGYAFVGALFGGKISGAARRLGQTDTGPKETAFNLSTEQNKQIMRLIVIELAKKALGSKAEGLPEAFVYQYGLSLLLEGLNEEDAAESSKEGIAGEEGASTGDEGSKATAESNPDIRGQISWEKLSERLDAENFFLFDTDLTLGSEEKAARIQYHFGSRLAAITRLCFGVDITDVEKLSVRDAQAISLSDLLVKRDAQVGEPSLEGVKKRESSIRGKGDTVDLEEFGNLINHFGGDTAKLTLYLIMTGKLDSLLQAMKGSKQTAEEVFASLSSAISGNMPDLPKELEASAEEAIQNLNDDSWIGKLIENLNLDLPITIIFNDYDDGFTEGELKELIDNKEYNNGIVQQLMSFSGGYRAPTQGNRVAVANQDKNKHHLLIQKSKGDKNKRLYRFTTEEQNARRLIFDNINFIKLSDAVDLKGDDDLKLLVRCKSEAAVFDEFELRLDDKSNLKDKKIQEKIAAVLIIRAMRKPHVGDFKKYQDEITLGRPDDKNRLDGKEYAIEVLRLLGIKDGIKLVSHDQDDHQAQNMGKITQALRSHHERHLALYKMWKSR